MIGGIAMLVGSIDPLVGSLLLLSGSGLVALGTFLGKGERALARDSSRILRPIGNELSGTWVFASALRWKTNKQRT
jgi:hypothetical protein